MTTTEETTMTQVAMKWIGARSSRMNESTLRDAINESIEHGDLAHCNVNCVDIIEVVDLLERIVDHLDYVRLSSNTFDVWGWNDDTEWRIIVTIKSR
jgi:hypothetical protein